MFTCAQLGKIEAPAVERRTTLWLSEEAGRSTAQHQGCFARKLFGWGEIILRCPCVSFFLGIKTQWAAADSHPNRFGDAWIVWKCEHVDECQPVSLKTWTYTNHVCPAGKEGSIVVRLLQSGLRHGLRSVNIWSSSCSGTTGNERKSHCSGGSKIAAVVVALPLKVRLLKGNCKGNGRMKRMTNLQQLTASGCMCLERSKLLLFPVLTSVWWHRCQTKPQAHPSISCWRLRGVSSVRNVQN